MVEMASALEESNDEILWHYTNTAGFLGILRSHSIWASCPLFLDDSAEFYQAYKVIRDFVANSEYDELDRRLVDLAIEIAGGNSQGILSDISHVGVFAASFSSERDDLSQWRGYASNPGGYCMGFSSSTLREFGAKQGFRLERVRYQRDDQYQLIRPLVEGFLTECRKLSLTIELLKGLDKKWPWRNVNVGETLPRLMSDFMVKSQSIAPILKHSSFEKEGEWRLVSQKGSVSLSPEVRDTESGLVPYVPVELSEPDDYMELRQVIIGPSPRGNLNLLASIAATYKHKVNSQSVVRSKLPIRNW